MISQRGAPTAEGVRQPIIAENCVKMKTIWTERGSADLLFGQIYPKTAWKREKLDREGEACLAHPIGSATASVKKIFTFKVATKQTLNNVYSLFCFLQTAPENIHLRWGVGISRQIEPLWPIDTERKRKQKFSLMFAVYSFILFVCSLIFFAFALDFAWCELALISWKKSKLSLI